ncbi:hypothetical protein [Aquisalinus flavus]|uniref:BPP domain-containing protein n=1 Tax=Aquisalinus flavus TaxID=1526572 RepID=A0A8J2V790_9PROT|nr:hypothetical protein [Aquisalinus flavus]MBD0427704.1 hypothetical protein [Aquisalinus flavus]UNE47482.1 hypothetical protein FF099_05125 [Aquisalinus flavus]GGD03151.1 hypothetical protein GCM10011342_10190 [Aquisalinus flavus]
MVNFSRRRLTGTAALLALLAACSQQQGGRENQTDESAVERRDDVAVEDRSDEGPIQSLDRDDEAGDGGATPAPEEMRTDIPVTDELGSFASEVHGLALWAHPTVAYQGAVLAANGDAGLIAIDFEKGNPDAVEGTFVGGLAVTYPDWTRGDESLIAAYDADSGYRFFDIDAEALTFREWEVSGANALPADPLQICVVARGDAAIADIAVIGQENTISHASINQNQDGSLSMSAPVTVNVPQPLACAGDDSHGIIVIATGTGKLVAVGTGGETSDGSDPDDRPFVDRIATLPSSDVNGIATSLQSGQGQILLSYRGEDARFFGYDIETGEELGAFTVSPLSEIDGVSGLNLFAADGGNFGGIYRKGVLATIGGDETRTLKLAPLSTALRNWSLFDADVLNRRDITQKDEPVDDGALDFSVPDFEDL